MKRFKLAVWIFAVLAIVALPVVYAATVKSLDVERSSSQYASIADGSQTGLDITENITVEAWIKMESLPTSGAEWNVVGKWANAGNVGQSYALNVYDVSGDVVLRGIVGDGSAFGYLTSTPGFQAGIWYHIAFSWKAIDGSMKLYVNGSDTGASNGGSVLSGILNGNGPFYIGSADFDGNGSADAHFDGLIDDARIWDTVRSPAEIANNYSAELTGAEAHLQGYWQLNNDYLDETSNNNDLTSSGSPVFSESVPYIKIFNP